MLSRESVVALRCLEKALPPSEWTAVKLWLSTFYRYQIDWILDQSQIAIVNKCRQNGASHSFSAWAVLRALFGEDTVLVSVGEREAIDLLEKVSKHCEALRDLGSGWAACKPSRTTVRLATGASIDAVPASSGGRGGTCNVVMDEFAYPDHPEAIWEAGAGAATHGFRVRVVSTPDGVGNLFHKLWLDADKLGYRKHLVTIDEAKADGMPYDDKACWALARGDPRLYDQLYRGRFLDADAQYIPSVLVEESIAEDVYAYGEVCFAGLDIGRTADLTALVICARDEDNVFKVQEVATCRRTSQADLDAMVQHAFDTYDIKKLCVDATGLGAFPAEAMQRRYGRFKVEPVTFTNQSKEDIVTTMYQAFAERRLKMLKSETALRDDVQAIRRIITAAGNVRYDAPHTDDGHADRAWALALAIHAGTTNQRGKNVIAPSTEYEYER